MTSDPAKVGHAAKSILRVNIEAVLDRHRRAKEEATDGVHDALGLTSRARGLKRRFSGDHTVFIILLT